MVQYLFHAVILIQPHDGHAVGIISIDKGKISAVLTGQGSVTGTPVKKQAGQLGLSCVQPVIWQAGAWVPVW